VPHLDPPAPDAQLVEAVPAQNPLAAQLTRQAHNAAVHGHCGGVVDAGERVHDLDATYHAKVFVADHAIAWCLQESQ
jgi:hypothetical protein